MIASWIWAAACTSAILLDLSAAFDTIDHSILLNRLKGTNGTALSWFESYLTNRKLRIKTYILIPFAVGPITSTPYKSVVRLWPDPEKFPLLNYGVPQGSCLGPLLFVIYASEMFPVIDNNSQKAHGYADDTIVLLT